MATYTGIDAELRIGTIPSKLACCEKFTVKEAIDIKADNELGQKWDKNVSGTHSFTVSGTCNLDYTDENRKLLIDANGEEVSFEADAGNLTLSGVFLLDSNSIPLERGNIIKLDFTGKGTGELTKAAKV
jgi:hypothetical protein